MADRSGRAFGHRDGLPLLILLLMPVAVLWPEAFGMSSDPMLANSGLLLSARAGWLPGSTDMDLNGGVTTQALGHLVAEQWLAGRVPWWNPYSGIGLPLAGEMQTSAFFLPFVLLLHFAWGPLLLKASLQMVAGLATYGLLRTLGVSRLAAGLGGVVFELNGTFAWLLHGPIMPIAFLPLFLWGIELCAIDAGRGGTTDRRRALWCGSGLVTVAVGWSLAGGFPEPAYIDGLLALGWAICRIAGSPRRLALAAWIGWSGLAGVLLAAPVLWSFGHMLLNSLPVHQWNKPYFGIPLSGLANILFPYVYGPLQASLPGDASGQLIQLVPWLGGYAGLALPVLALAGLGGRTHRALRLLLAAWVVLCLGHAFNVPGIVWLTRHVPLVMLAIFPRYAVASWVMACIVLAMLGLDDARQGRRWPVWTLVGPALALCAVALALAAPLIRALLDEIPLYGAWLAATLAWGIAVTVASVWALSRRRFAALACVVALDAAAMFSLPMLSGLRDGVLDRPAIDFLRAGTARSLQRFYGLGVYRPNYGAYFDTPQLNDEYLPVPANWGNHVEQVLDPGSDSVFFRGDVPDPASARAADVRERRALFAALAVRFIVAPAGASPFLPFLDKPGGTAPPVARALADGDRIDGEIAADPALPPQIGAFGIRIGTYLGASDGQLEVELCAAERCVHGALPLAGAADNQIARIPLDAPLRPEGASLRYRVTHTGSRAAVAVWLSPAPTLRLEADSELAPPPRVYADNLLDIYELPEAKAYLSTDGADCRLEVDGRETLRATCAAPARLIRRELFYPGWRATVNGVPVAIADEGGLVQRIDLPAGQAEIRFAYAPPYAGLAWFGSALGLAMLALPWGFARRRRSA